LLELLFQLKLSFLLIEEPLVGVSGVLDGEGSLGSMLCILSRLGCRSAVGARCKIGRLAILFSGMDALEFLPCETVLCAEDVMYGEIECLVVLLPVPDILDDTDDAARRDEDEDRAIFIWLNSWLKRFVSAKLTLEAVKGVVGVSWPEGLKCMLDPSYVVSCISLLLTLKALTLAIVGVLRGRRFKGGSCNGCRDFFNDDVEVFGSKECPRANVTPLFRRISGSILVEFGVETLKLLDCFVGVPKISDGGALSSTLLNGFMFSSTVRAFGNGGTGGMSSSDPPDLPFVVGNRDVIVAWPDFACSEPVETRAELLFEPVDVTELKDFRLISEVGVGVDDDMGTANAVVLMDIGARDGERFSADGIGGAVGNTDKRFIRRASVGLTVLAPRPVACA